MTERSWFWAGTSTGDAALASPYGAPYTDDLFSDVFNLLLNYDRSRSGVVLTKQGPYNQGFGHIWDGGSGLTVYAGAALVDGKLYTSDSSKAYTFTANGTWQIVLRKDFGAQTVRMLFRQGSSVTQSDGTIWELELWRFVYSAGNPLQISDKRNYLASNSPGRMLIDSVEIGWHANPTPATAVFSLMPPVGVSSRIHRLEIDFSDVVATGTGTEVYPFGLFINGDNGVLNKYRWGYSLTDYQGLVSQVKSDGTSNATKWMQLGEAGRDTGAYNLAHGRITIYNWNEYDNFKAVRSEGVVHTFSTAKRFEGFGIWLGGINQYVETITLAGMDALNNSIGTFNFGRFWLYAVAG